MVSPNCVAGPSSLRLTRPRHRLLSTSPIHFNHYKTLGVPLNATKAQIKSHFYQLSKKHHPDVSKDAKSTELFSRVTEAYTVLSNDRERRVYDRSLQLLSRSGPGPTSLNYGYRPRPGSTATHAWESSSRRHSSPYTRSGQPHAHAHAHAHRAPHAHHRAPGTGAHYEPWRPPSHGRTTGSASGYVNQNDKVLEELQRDLAIQRISGSLRALQILCVLAMAVGVIGGLR